MQDSFIKRSLPYIISIVIMLLVSIMYFYPQFQGKVLQQSDLVNFSWMSQESKEFRETTGEQTLWTNSMFGGMPTYQLGAQEPSNVSKPLYKVMRLGIPRPAGLFFVGALSFFIMMLCFKVNVWVSLITALAFAFSTNNLVLFNAGHTSKVLAIMVSPLIISGVALTYARRWLMGIALFSLGMSMNLMANHYQMTYYLGICLFILVVGYLITLMRKGDFRTFFTGSMLLLLGLAISVGTSSTRLLTTYEYSQDTMRGDPILNKKTDDFSSSGVKGLSFPYAMQWSNGWEDVWASYIPMAAGGSSAEKVASSSELGAKLKRRGVPMRDGGVVLGTYWGKLPFTSGPIYFGAVMFFLFFLGSFLVKGPIKYFLVISTILTLLLSMGKNLEFLSKFFFDYVPLYNKFRTPNSILSVTAIFIPLLGGLAIREWMKDINKQKQLRSLYISTGITAGFALVLALMGPSFFDFSSTGDVRYEQAGFDVSLFEEHRVSMLAKSCFRSAIFIILTALLLFLFKQGRLKSAAALAGLIGVLSLIDLMPINARYLSGGDFVNKRASKANFEPRPVDKQIMNDTELYFRVHDLTSDPWSSARPAYFHKAVGGYHAAKLQRYQDIIDMYLSKNNEKILNMLNTKYVIAPGQNGEPQVQLNPAAMGNAWFVKNIDMVLNANQEIDALQDFDPRGTAVVHQDFKDIVPAKEYSQQGTIQLKTYAPNKLEYTVTANGDQFAVFSDIWYGPDKGWNAYLDGEKVPHARANYILRAMAIPSGTHELRFEFEPSSFKTGSTIALVSSVLLILLLLSILIASYNPAWFPFTSWLGDEEDENEI